VSDRRADPGRGGALPAKLEAAEAAAGGGLPGPYRHQPDLVYTWAQELIRHPRIVDAVEDAVGPDILAWESVFFTKEPQTEDYISWHQDITYWGSRPRATWSPPGWR
jgi:non-heme Fe2+,alpha-ketoglutarate-dependent halogenase